MASLPLAVRDHDGEKSPVRVMKGAMAPPFIEKHEAFMTQERGHLGEPDVAGRVSHSFDQFGSPAHRAPFHFR
jgi:hypothetical protein